MSRFTRIGKSYMHIPPVAENESVQMCFRVMDNKGNPFILREYEDIDKKGDPVKNYLAVIGIKDVMKDDVCQETKDAYVSLVAFYRLFERYIEKARETNIAEVEELLIFHFQLKNLQFMKVILHFMMKLIINLYKAPYNKGALYYFYDFFNFFLSLSLSSIR